MATYKENQVWAARSSRRQVALYLYEEDIASLDAMATWMEQDTGNKRRAGRAEAITALIRRQRSLWEGRDYWQQRCKTLTAEVEALEQRIRELPTPEEDKSRTKEELSQ
jgi:hypothetical protein